MPVEQTPRTRMDAPLPATPEPEPEPQPAPNGIHHATTWPYRTGRRAPEAIGANPLSNALCTDMYQITMAYSFWFNNRHDDEASYDLFFRKNPFGGEYTVFCGLEECVRLVSNFGFTPEQIAYLRSVMPECGDDFFDWLGKLDCSGVRVYALQEGTVCFPRIPLLRVEGPLAICQMLETPLLNCVNYPTLVATNAARLKVAAGEGKGLLETGLRRAQGPDGAVSGSRYAFIGGFDGTSNVQAGMMFSILPKGAHAHSYVMSYSGLEELQVPDGRTISTRSGETADIVAESLAWQGKLGSRCGLAPGHQGELAAFCAYARANPTSFLALVDSYDTLKSGLVNFLAVSLALHAAGYAPVGIALDSGDLAYQSKEARRIFRQVADAFEIPSLRELRIVASNGISVNTLESLRQQNHEIDIFCIGTNLVTCEGQPALGAVYKLCEIEGKPRIKISMDVVKMTVPGRKSAYRLYNRANEPAIDLLCQVGQAPRVGEQTLCKHPFDDVKRCYITPSKVVPLHTMVWGPENEDSGKPSSIRIDFPTIEEIRQHAMRDLQTMRPDHRRILNPTPYKVSVTNELHLHLHELWQGHVPISDLS